MGRSWAVKVQWTDLTIADPGGSNSIAGENLGDRKGKGFRQCVVSRELAGPKQPQQSCPNGKLVNIQVP